MSPRVAGAALALLAALLLVASVAGIPTGWWAGSPLKNGEAMHKKDVDVSLVSAIGCNTGGDGTCEPLELTGGFETARYAQLGATGILVLACLLLAGVTLAASERRKRCATVVISVAVACVGIAIALILMPKMKAAGIELPISKLGLGMFMGGIACAVIGSVLAMRPTPKLELQPSRQSFAPALAAPPTAQPVDVLAMLQPEPVHQSRPPPSPGGQLAGPAGPLAPLSFGPPPMSGPPDGRPRPGTGAPPVPDRAKSASSSMPSIPGDRSKASSQMPPLPPSPPPIPGSRGSGTVPAIPDARTKPSSVPPPSAEARTKAASIPPPNAAARAKAASVAPPSADLRPKSPSVAPVPSTVAGMMPPTRAKGVTGLPPPRAKGPSVPPPATAPKPTTVAAVVPPPRSAPLLSTMLPIRADTDPSESLETMDRDAMTIARDGSPAVSIGRPATDASIGDNTDAAVALPEDRAIEERTDLAAQPIEPPPLEARDSASDIQTSMQRKLTQSELVRAVARESQTEIETIAREKISARDLAIGDSTNPAIIPGAGHGANRSSAKEIAELGEAATVPATGAAPSSPDQTPAPVRMPAPAPAKIPMSTASESLPPPKKVDGAVSGPTPACPQCEAPMAWVEEHLRFYCKSCRMYF